jgi:hypothetical protein
VRFVRGRSTGTLALALCLAALHSARAQGDPQPALELELAGGVGKAGSSSQLGTNSPYPWAPIVTGRAGIDLWNVFTPSVRVFAVAGPSELDYTATDPSEYGAVSGLLELRVHSPGDTQIYASAGAGIGRVFGLQRTNAFESNRIFSQTGPAFLGVVGVRRLLSPKFAIGGEIATSFWTRGEHGGIPGSCCAYQGGGPPESGLTIYGVSLLLSVTWIPTR